MRVQLALLNRLSPKKHQAMPGHAKAMLDLGGLQHRSALRTLWRAFSWLSGQRGCLASNCKCACNGPVSLSKVAISLGLDVAVVLWPVVCVMNQEVLQTVYRVYTECLLL